MSGECEFLRASWRAVSPLMVMSEVFVPYNRVLEIGVAAGR
jgi:hypothetical protein